MEKGIIIIGAGNEYYGRQACSLAASIRSSDKEIPVLILTTPGCIPDRMLSIIQANANVTIDYLPEFAFMEGEKQNFFKSKVYAYDLSPFDKTILLDADMLWITPDNTDRLFAELSKTPFSMSNEGKVNVREGTIDTTRWYTIWAEYNQIIKHYKTRLGDFYYQLRSEFMYFEKSPTMKKFFSIAKKIYDAPRVDHVKIGGHTPDELPLSLASSITGIYPHKDKWTPAYWYFRRQMMHQGQMNSSEIQFSYPILSIGGNVQNKELRDFYNARAKYYCSKIGLVDYHVVSDKAHVLPERKKI
jgi:hypothetical protein